MGSLVFFSVSLSIAPSLSLCALTHRSSWLFTRIRLEMLIHCLQGQNNQGPLFSLIPGKSFVCRQSVWEDGETQEEREKFRVPEREVWREIKSGRERH